MTAQYGAGSVSSFRVGEDGGLSDAVTVIQHQGSGADPKRQAGPHAHSIRMTPENKFAVACDLGLDKVLIYRVDQAKGELVSHGFGTVPPGSGPRHLAFHTNGHFAFVNNEMKMTVSTMAYDGGKGALTLVDTVSTIPAEDRGMPGLSTAETVVHPNGKFVYVSNRGHDTIAVLSCNATTGKLTLVANVKTEGRTPRNFALDLTGKWLIAGHQVLAGCAAAASQSMKPWMRGLSFASVRQMAPQAPGHFTLPGTGRTNRPAAKSSSANGPFTNATPRPESAISKATATVSTSTAGRALNSTSAAANQNSQ
jgi:6-phosphogluconolactonase